MITDLGNSFKAETGDLSTRLTELEKRAAREPDSYRAANDNLPSLGELVANHDAVRDLNSNFRGKATVKLVGDEFAAITSGTSTVGATTSPGTSLVPAHRVDGIVSPAERRLRIRDVLNVAQTTSNSVEWPRETGFTNNAAPVAETNAKPYSDLTFNLQTTSVRTVAHLFKASRQILDDAPGLVAYINRRGIHGLKLVEENQLLNGDGTGQNLNGIMSQATAFAPTWSAASDTAIDRLNQALSQVEDSNYEANAILLNPRDWRQMIAIKDGEGRYIAGQSPFGIQAPRVWGVPIVATAAVAPGEFLTGAFDLGATLYDRMGVEVLLSTENDDDFEKNLVTIRIEERLALAVFRPDAFVAGDLVPSGS